MSATISGAKRSIYGLLVVLVVFLVVSDALIISQVYLNQAEQRNDNASSESLLFASLVSEALTKGDYTGVEYAANGWGMQKKSISSITIAAANGFTLAKYTRGTAADIVQKFHETIEYGADKTATIDLVIDVSDNYTYLARLVAQLVGFSILLVILLGFFLKRAALQPLQDEIEEHRRTEHSLEQYMQALATSNKELESFSYSVAHDLRAPLRAITSFSQLIKQEAAGKLNADEHDYLDRVIKAGLHLAQLLDDLLELARISRTEMRVTNVDLSELANLYLEQQQSANPDREVSCSVENNVVVQGDPDLLQRVLNNLLGNAWKYTENTEAAHIEFGVTAENDHDVYYVRDNGVGFDMQYADKLFKPFQRLHGSGEFEGTGIGLANVKQIIQRHGGDVWVNAQTGLGATFYFTLPGPSP